MDPKTPQCARCETKERICAKPDGKGPAFCPTLHQKELLDRAVREYRRPEVREFARAASVQEAECYIHRDVKPYVMHPAKPRVQETCEFALKMGYRKLGIAHCAGLRQEAKTLTQILESQGFEVVSVACKVGGTPKEEIGIREEEKIRIGEFETMCSPIAQAMILNEEKTDFNILLGLCVGHDSLFMKYSQPFCTVLVAKDRVLGHNPVAALYGSGTYYARLGRKGF